MAQLVRKCSQCGSVDTKNTWSSADDAAKKNAFDGKWSCSSCAWTDFELVENEAQTTQQRDTVNAG
jgi:hypothetical protein